MKAQGGDSGRVTYEKTNCALSTKEGRKVGENKTYTATRIRRGDHAGGTRT